MPDGISAAVINGETYLLTANEGDSRAWQAGSETDTNEIKDKTSPQTGDGSGLHLYIALLLISGGTPGGIAAAGRGYARLPGRVVTCREIIACQIGVLRKKLPIFPLSSCFSHI